MPPSFDKDLGGAGGLGVVDITTSQAASASSRIFLACSFYSDTGTLTGMTNAGGLTWQILRQLKHPDNGWRIGLLTADAPSGLASDSILTPSFSDSPSAYSGTAFSALGMIGGTTDITTGTPADSTGYEENWSSGNITTDVADALLVAVHSGIASSQQSYTVTSPALAANQRNETGDGNASHVAGYRILSSTGTYAIAGTSGASVYMESTIIVGIKAGVSGQFSRPSADSVDGSWTDQAGGTSLYAAIDETTPSDSDYIRSPLTPNSSGCRIKLSSVSSPQAGTRTFRWRAGKDVTGGGTINMVARLRQGGGDSLGGGTLVQEFTRNNVDAATTYAETVTEPITNYADLYVEFYATQT